MSYELWTIDEAGKIDRHTKIRSASIVAPAIEFRATKQPNHPRYRGVVGAALVECGRPIDAWGKPVTPRGVGDAPDGAELIAQVDVFAAAGIHACETGNVAEALRCFKQIKARNALLGREVVEQPKPTPIGISSTDPDVAELLARADDTDDDQTAGIDAELALAS